MKVYRLTLQAFAWAAGILLGAMALAVTLDVVIRNLGLGNTGWSEPSLFVVGADTAMLDILARRHDQLAYIHGRAGGTACAKMAACSGSSRAAFAKSPAPMQ